MEQGISRRGLMAVAGASAVLASCGGTSPSDNKSTVGIAGPNNPYGINPHAPPAALTNVAFAPDYVTVIRIDSPGAWRFTANHASFGIDAGNNTPEARLAQALRILRKTGPGKKLGTLRPGTPDGEDRIYRHPDHGNDPNAGYDRDDFRDFAFASQHELFVYYDNPDVTLQAGNLLSFSHFLVNGTDRADENDSFVVERVPDAQLPASLKGKLIRIKNYNAVKASDGTFRRRDPKVESDAARYSMNFHFTVPASRPIPMVLDPDVGNGYGGRP